MTVDPAFGFILAECPRMSLRSTLGFTLSVASVLLAPPADAALHVQADSVAIAGVEVRTLDATVDGAPTGSIVVELTMGSLSVPALGWQSVKLVFSGQLERNPGARWALHGDLKLRGAPGGAVRSGKLRLTAAFDANTLHAEVRAASASIDMALPLDQPTHIQLELEAVPASWLQGVLQQVWNEGRATAGRVGAQVALDMGANGLHSTGTFKLHEVGVDSRSGTVAAAGLSATGRWALDTTDASTKLDLSSVLRGGEILLGPVYAALPEHAAQLRLNADISDERARLSSLHFDDGDALRVNGNMTFGSDGSVHGIDVQNLRANFPAAYARYAKSWLATQGFANLTTSGTLVGSLEYGAGLEQFSFEAQALDVSDPSGRVAAQKLTGGLDWSREADHAGTQLSWQALRLLGLPFGPATTHWQSTDGSLSLQSPTSVPLLGGAFLLQRAAWRPRADADETRLDLGFVLTDVDLPALCDVFGWPRFSGILGGAVPGLTFTAERIELQGGLLMHVFDGFVNVTHLSLQDPFGAAPLLHADIDIEDLDLEPLTQVFDFGSITGRLNGSINDLTTVNWRPVAFDGEVHTDGSGRISQRAINSLSNLGGGGIAGGLQGAMLSIFDSFGYSAISLNCRLHDEVCEMGGLHPVPGGGYLIVDGRGLPHIKVIGHQHEVDWPTLVARLREATQGESTPRIE